MTTATATSTTLTLPPDLDAAIDRLLASANGRRRTRTLSRSSIDRLIARGLNRDLGDYETHDGGSVANSYGYPAVSTVALIAVTSTGVYLGISEANCPSPSPGRAWSELQPFGVGRPETLLPKFDRWVQARHANVIRIFSYE